MSEPASRCVHAILNGQQVEFEVEPRETLADALRRTQGTRSIRLGCEHGACGACTVRIDGRTARSCLIFAVQAVGTRIETADALADHDPIHRRLVDGFAGCNSFQCGFCATGMLMTVGELLAEDPAPDEAKVRDRLSGHLCRCTGYESIVAGVLHAVHAIADGPTSELDR